MPKVKLYVLTLLLPVVAILILTGVFDSADVLAAENGKGYSMIDVRTLSGMLKKKDFILINVHIPYEGEIEKTDLFIPYDKIEQSVHKLPADKNAKIVLYCRTDRMSKIAGGKMVGLGYTNVIVVTKGMIEWKKQGYEILFKGQ